MRPERGQSMVVMMERATVGGVARWVAHHPDDGMMERTAPDVTDLVVKARARMRTQVVAEMETAPEDDPHDWIDAIVETECEAVAIVLRAALNDVAVWAREQAR